MERPASGAETDQPNTQSRAAVSERDDRPLGSPPTAAHAVLWAMRFPGDETQLTQVIAEVARADPTFAGDFVSVLLKAARRDGHAKNAETLLQGSVPERFVCKAEEHLRDDRDAAHGRVDDGGDMTLFVENKLFGGYGKAQVKRYLAALERLPEDRRAGLIAVTRDYPGYGEPSPSEHPGWLGSVRWSRIMHELPQLTVRPPELEQQWRWFLQILDDDGDLGRTKVDSELIRAWARYRDGRAELEELLTQVAARALDIVQAAFKKKYPRAGSAETLAALYRRGERGQVIAQRDQTRVYLAFCVPAIVDPVSLSMIVSASSGQPELVIEASPWEGAERIAQKESEIEKASERLQDAGYERHRGRWERRFPAREFLDADDVPARLLEILSGELSTIVSSGIFDSDVRLAVARSRDGPPSLKAIPAYDDE